MADLVVATRSPWGLREGGAGVPRRLHARQARNELNGLICDNPTFRDNLQSRWRCCFFMLLQVAAGGCALLLHLLLRRLRHRRPSPERAAGIPGCSWGCEYRGRRTWAGHLVQEEFARGDVYRNRSLPPKLSVPYG